MLNIKRVIASKPKAHDVGKPNRLLTPWGEALDPVAVRQEHPRPLCARDSVRMLNGCWEYVITPGGNAQSWQTAKAPETWEGSIVVPFSPESLLSGVGHRVMPDELLWYGYSLPIDETMAATVEAQGQVVLHFEAVDYCCALWVQGKKLGTHRGGYLPFSFDLTSVVQEALAADAATSSSTDETQSAPQPSLDVRLCVWDPTDQGTQLRGKQKLENGGIWYSAQSGIWQPVWLELRPSSWVEWLEWRATPALDGLEGTLIFGGDPQDVEIQAVDEQGREFRCSIPASELTPYKPSVAPYWDERVEEEQAAFTPQRYQASVTLHFDAPLLWTPETPALYDLTITYGSDQVTSYGAVRQVQLAQDESGHWRLYLNGKPYHARGVLDQGYWPDGLMTAPAEEAFVFDIQAMKDAGFNMLRKHIKIESERWYYLCDRLGMLVWQDMVSGGGPLDQWLVTYQPTFFSRRWGAYRDTTAAHQRKLAAGDPAYRQEWLDTTARAVTRLANHPSIVCWVLFNESWGQFDAFAATKMVAGLDNSRLIDSVSGWYDQHCGDILSVHDYFRDLHIYPDNPAKLQGRARTRGGRAFSISEFGGLAYPVAGHTYYQQAYGYDVFRDPHLWRQGVHDVMKEADDLVPLGLAASVYTQLSDVEEEVNGLLTYDRRRNKLTDAPERLAPDAGLPVAGEPDAQQLFPPSLRRQLDQQFERAFSDDAHSGSRRIYVAAPGRVEIAGNHVDHQGGQVISGAIAKHIYVCAQETSTPELVVESEGFGRAVVYLKDPGWSTPRPEEKKTFQALVRGVAAAQAARGIPVAGTAMVVEATLPCGAGLSSSAAFEVAVGFALEVLRGSSTQFPEGGLLRPEDPVALALAGQKAEGEYFGKPTGAQDQLASALGGVSLLDFSVTPPHATALPFNADQAGFSLVLIDSAIDHSAHTDAFNSIPQAMHTVAAVFGKTRLSEVAREDFFASLAKVHAACGGDACLRAIHYYDEVERVRMQCESLMNQEFDRFVELARLSGASSAEFLRSLEESTQAASSDEHPLALISALCCHLLEDAGAWRIHGGGFGGGILAFVPQELTPGFIEAMNGMLGDSRCTVVEPGAFGVCALVREP